jgi:phage shock protein C
MNNQFARTRGDRMIGGVCGGIARYFNIDPVIVRLLFVLAVFLGGVSPLIYVLLWVVMPEEQAAYVAPQALPDHPRPVEEWKFDPYTGEKINK